MIWYRRRVIVIGMTNEITRRKVLTGGLVALGLPLLTTALLRARAFAMPLSPLRIGLVLPHAPTPPPASPPPSPPPASNPATTPSPAALHKGAPFDAPLAVPAARAAILRAAILLARPDSAAALLLAGPDAADSVFALAAQQVQQGVRYRADALNAHHADHVELIPGDDPSALLEAGVHALIGVGEAVARAGQASCTPTILAAPGSPGAGMPGMPAPMPSYVFQAGPTASQVRAKLLSALTAEKVGLLSLDPPYVEDFAARGLTLVASKKIPPETTTTLAQLAQAVVSATPAPEAIVVDAVPPLDGIAVRDLRAAGWTGPIVCGPSAVHNSFQAIAGEATEGVVAVAPWFAAPREAPADLPNLETMRRFAEGFSADHGRPSSYAGFGADALSLLHLAYLGHRDRKMAQAQLAQMCCVGVSGVYNPGLPGDALTRLAAKDGLWTLPES